MGFHFFFLRLSLIGLKQSSVGSSLYPWAVPRTPLLRSLILRFGGTLLFNCACCSFSSEILGINIDAGVSSSLRFLDFFSFLFTFLSSSSKLTEYLLLSLFFLSLTGLAVFNVAFSKASLVLPCINYIRRLN